jgi:16S rRNA (uracil1498-N3)-methyltransferase
MTHRFLIGAGQLDGQIVTFTDQQAHQLQHVLRLRAGDHVCVFDGATPHDYLVELEKPERARVINECPQAREPRTRLVAYPALLQRDKFEPVLQKLTELGVAAIVPVITARGLVRETPDERRSVRWRAILREAAEQSGRGVVPELLPAEAFGHAIASAEGTRVMAYELERSGRLSDALMSKPTSVALFVGPEGGYTEEEAGVARAAGAHLITMGPRILRTETASPVLAALVLYELGDLINA